MIPKNAMIKKKKVITRLNLSHKLLFKSLKSEKLPLSQTVFLASYYTFKIMVLPRQKIAWQKLK